MRQENDKVILAMSKLRKTVLMALCLFGLILFVWLDNSIARYRRRSKSFSDEQTNLLDQAEYHRKKFVVQHVVDGDTIDIKTPDGRPEYTRIRLLGIDTPEIDGRESTAMYFAPEAAEFTRQATLGKTVTIYLDTTGPTRGKYGRLLAYVKLPDGQFLNELLLTEGYAYSDTRFDHSFYNKYKQLQSDAKSSKKGLWLNVTADQLPKWLKLN